MEANELMFDDWAMFLVDQWVEAHEACESRKQVYIDGEINFEAEVERTLNQAHAQLYALVSYLKTVLEYDVSPYRRAYAQYIVLDNVHLDALLSLIAPTYEGEPMGYRSFIHNRSKRKLFEKYLLSNLKSRSDH